MFHRIRSMTLLIALGALPQTASAEQLRFHFVPADACGTMTQVAAGPEGSLGELRRGWGARPANDARAACRWAFAAARKAHR